MINLEVILKILRMLKLRRFRGDVAI